jgi:hypothetical protein
VDVLDCLSFALVDTGLQRSITKGSCFGTCDRDDRRERILWFSESGLEQRSMVSFDSDFISIFVFGGNTEVNWGCLIELEENEISEPDEIVMIDCWRWRWRRPEDRLGLEY